jgi:hypothetical protein
LFDFFSVLCGHNVVPENTQGGYGV